MRPLYQGYPQRPDAHHAYPWWRYVASMWQRRDGLVRAAVILPGEDCPDIDATDAKLASVDLEHPRPCPRLLCGQVWVRGGIEDTILRIRRVGHITKVSFCGGDEEFDDRHPRAPDGVLVAGPLSPWADTAKTINQTTETR